ncbi:WxL domain-containing protein [Actinocorallia aurea]
MMKRQAALRAVMAGATAVAAPAVAAMTVAGEPAFATDGTVTYQCKIFNKAFTYSARIKASGPPSPAGVGDTARIEADFSPLPAVAPLDIETWSTSVKLLASGAQTGSYDMTGGQKKGPVPKGQKLPIGEVSADVPLSAGGTVKFKPGKLVITATSFGISVDIDCAPKKTAVIYTLKVRGESAPVTLLADPVTVAPGTPIALKGSGWKKGPVEVHLCDAQGKACSGENLENVTASIDDAGDLLGSATVKQGTADGTYKLKVIRDRTTKFVAIQVKAAAAPVDPCAGKEPDQCTTQDVNVTVTGGPLTLSKEQGEVTLTAVTLDGTNKTATGALRAVTIADARGASTGWTLVGTLTDFTGQAGATIAAGNLTWTPRCGAQPGSTPVVTGSPGALGEGGALLCSTTDSTTGPVGGTYEAGADLSLNVPAATATGEYDAILTLTLS